MCSTGINGLNNNNVIGNINELNSSDITKKEESLKQVKPSISEIEELDDNKGEIRFKNLSQQESAHTGPSVGVHSSPQKPLPKLHPHLGGNFAQAIDKVFNPKEINSGSEEAIFNSLKSKGIINANGDIDFKKLGLSSLEIKKMHLKGSAWMDSNGKFQVKVNGTLGDSFVKAFGQLKNTVGNVAKENGLENPITLNPEVLGKPSKEDMDALSRGGQIQYRAYGMPPETLKLVLDPGQDGKDDGLSISVVERNNPPKKIPLSVVFGGQEFNGKKTDHPLLADWRERKLFEDSQIRKEYDHFIPFVSFFDKKVADTTGDVARVQSENTLWNAVNEYLKWSLDENSLDEGILGGYESGSGSPINENIIKDEENLEPYTAVKVDSDKIEGVESDTGLAAGIMKKSLGVRAVTREFRKHSDNRNRYKLLNAARELADEMSRLLGLLSDGENDENGVGDVKNNKDNKPKTLEKTLLEEDSSGKISLGNTQNSSNVSLGEELLKSLDDLNVLMERLPEDQKSVVKQSVKALKVIRVHKLKDRSKLRALLDAARELANAFKEMLKLAEEQINLEAAEDKGLVQGINAASVKEKEPKVSVEKVNNAVNVINSLSTQEKSKVEQAKQGFIKSLLRNLEGKTVDEYFDDLDRNVGTYNDIVKNREALKNFITEPTEENLKAIFKTP